MDTLRQYLKSLPVPEQEAFAVRCGTTIGYLRKAISVKATMGAPLCIAIERESKGAVRVESLDPRADWSYLRSAPPASEPEQARAA